MSEALRGKGRRINLGKDKAFERFQEPAVEWAKEDEEEMKLARNRHGGVTQRSGLVDFAARRLLCRRGGPLAKPTVHPETIG